MKPPTYSVLPEPQRENCGHHPQRENRFHVSIYLISWSECDEKVPKSFIFLLIKELILKNYFHAFEAL